MLAVKISSRRTKYVQVMEDGNGFYCEVFDDAAGKAYFDEFYIDGKKIPYNLKEPTERRKKALQLADEYVRRTY